MVGAGCRGGDRCADELCIGLRNQRGSFGTTTAGVYNQWIPKCATSIRYIVRGGGGGLANAANSQSVGAAAEITGEFTLPATWQGGWLKLIVGAGGEATQAGVGKGGIGFGRGGNGTDTSKNDGDVGWSCGGGGGSAITFENALLVAAGGGGGAPIALQKSSDGTLLVDVITYHDTHSASGFPFGYGSANHPNGTGMGLRKPGAEAAGALVAPARGGVNGGAGVSGTWVSPTTGNFEKAAAFAGDDGGALGSGLNGGGNGGSAAAAQNNYTLPGESEVLVNTAVGGGGGGGYHGGGGGGFAFFRENVSGMDKLAVAAASGGGAGSSFVATRVAGITVTGDVGMFTGAIDARPGHLGRVWVAWS